MKLLLDIGNTRIKAVLSYSDTLEPVEFDIDLFRRYPITRLTYASVRLAEKTQYIIDAAQKSGVKVVEVKTQAEAFGVHCAYQNYQTLGIDRWLAVLGVSHLYPNENIIVVDAGTATTVDFLTADKQHLGGWIIPGLELMTTSITSQTDKVFDHQDTGFSYGPGVTTPQALKHGCLAAQCGVVNQAVDYFDRPAKVVIAGGTAKLMLPFIKQYSPIYQPLVVFQGLDLF